MVVRKFYAESTRDALRQVRDALGADALILSNRNIAGGVIEIMAVAAIDLATLGPEKPITHVPQFSAFAGAPRDAGSVPPVIPETAAVIEPPTVSASPATEHQANLAPPASLTREIVSEVRSVRMMLETQLAGLAWSDLRRREPAKIEVLRQMLNLGFSPQFARAILDGLPVGLDLSRAFKWVREELVKSVPNIVAEGDIVERGGVYALVGPTGVGKTTTVAKIAARCVLRHGAAKVALLTTDSYRVGAHDQLRIYGKILGAPVFAIKDESALQLTLADLRSRHLILIDTVGMSQRDRRLAEQVALLCNNGGRVKRLLLLSAVSQTNTLDDVVQAYAGPGMEGCVLTKIDEALSSANVLDVIIRHKLPVHYVTNGQRVPEDLHLPNALYLIDRALRVTPNGTPFSFEEAEFPLLMAQGAEHLPVRPDAKDDRPSQGELHG